MHLAHVEVRNFRCLRELRVDLQQGLTVLVGRSNVGKTSLLAAIRHALGAAPAAARRSGGRRTTFIAPGLGASRPCTLPPERQMTEETIPMKAIVVTDQAAGT